MAKRKKKRTREESGPIVARPVDYDRPRVWKMWLLGKLFRYSGSMVLLLLNLSMVMSLRDRMMQGLAMDPAKELFFFAFLAVVDVMILIPLLFEANKVETDGERIRLQMLFFRRTLRWEQITAFEQPRFLKYVFLKTNRCFYLINKYNLKPFDDLAATIQAKLATKTIESAP